MWSDAHPLPLAAAPPALPPSATGDTRKLLWAAARQRAATPDAPLAAPVTARAASLAPAPAFGANRWDAAQFGSDAQRNKFLKLMGARSGGSAVAAGAAAGAGASGAALAGGAQQRVLRDVEAQFAAGVRQRGAGTRGLGS